VLYGALIRRAHNFYVERQDNPFVVSAFVLFVTTFHPSTDDLVSFQQQATLLLLMLALALLFATRLRRPNDSLSRLSYAAPVTQPHPVG
jgi:hypothetical protein